MDETTQTASTPVDDETFSLADLYAHSLRDIKEGQVMKAVVQIGRRAVPAVVRE